MIVSNVLLSTFPQAQDETGSREDMSEKEQAVLKIQQRARGMNDRKKVNEMKEKGELPGQQRAEGVQGTIPENVADTEGGEEGRSEQEQAAVKIQQRARGMNGRMKVAELKDQGALPGQQRKQSEDGQAESPEGTAEVDEEGDHDREKAALKIQQRARGMNDRVKVAELKDKGMLPGQQRTKSDEEPMQNYADAPVEGQEGMNEEETDALKIQQ